MSDYKQCRLQKGIVCRTMITYFTAWIPVKYAILNKVLKVKLNGEWEDGWTVTQVYHFTRDEKHLHILKNQHLKQREVSDT